MQAHVARVWWESIVKESVVVLDGKTLDKSLRLEVDGILLRVILQIV